MMKKENTITVPGLKSPETIITEGREIILLKPGEVICKKCSFKWSPRVEEPRACPKCKRYDWNED